MILFISKFTKVVIARNVREAPATAPATEDAWTEIWNSANETFTAFNQAILRVINVNDQTELVTKIQTSVKSLTDDVQTNVNKLIEEVCPSVFSIFH